MERTIGGPASAPPVQETTPDHDSVQVDTPSSRPMAASPSTIQIYARVRPIRPNTKLHVTPERYWCTPAEQDKPRIGFRFPRDQVAGLVNNQREVYEFGFDRVFDVTTGQEEVFDVVAKPVVLSVMDGYNGTIFAYGQTGSGKTFTITGGAERYADRGLIPRTLQFIFQEMQKRHDFHYEVSVSYLEIYNEIGYDLLDNTRDAKKLEDLPKVTLQEDEEGNIHLRNLASMPAKDEEDALNHLFIGDTNRMIAETPSNPASSRSHCLFIISMLGRKEGEDRIRRSKLHLVDLAGSERVARTGIGGNLLKEAKYINLSLHYLEQVIIALHEKALGKRTHVPYRNSMMTSVLRDSLGGNCRTTMVATVAVEDELIDESISTCRFAQRVALIANHAILNEELDPRLAIIRLKREVARLKAELAIARGEAGQPDGETLPDYEKDRVKEAVDDFICDPSLDASLVFSDFRKIHEAFRVMKRYISLARSAVHDGGAVTEKPRAAEGYSEPANNVIQENELERLRQLLAHRNNEINVLVSMMNNYNTEDAKTVDLLQMRQPRAVGILEQPFQLGDIGSERMLPNRGSNALLGLTGRLAASVPQLTTEKAKAFEIFKRGYPSGEWIEGQKALLKNKYTEAKALGEQASQLRSAIKAMKATLTQTEVGDAAAEEQSVDLRKRALESSARYKAAYQQLKDLKIEIEHLQHLLEQARHRLTHDFEYWYINVYLVTEDPLMQQSENDEARLEGSSTLETSRPRWSSMPTISSSRAETSASARYDSTKSVEETRTVISSNPASTSVWETHQMTAPTAGAYAAKLAQEYEIGVPNNMRSNSNDYVSEPPLAMSADGGRPGSTRQRAALPKYVYPPNMSSSTPQVTSNVPISRPCHIDSKIPSARSSPLTSRVESYGPGCPSRPITALHTLGEGSHSCLDCSQNGLVPSTPALQAIGKASISQDVEEFYRIRNGLLNKVATGR
ncbi:hypothetical protein SpCBS45565_g07339 [Spizellomyces sp. 'palustris']|nr:hypothetical protein SpCBS45565_g07339 [Spizellomyces sp. 'palustris']